MKKTKIVITRDAAGYAGHLITQSSLNLSKVKKFVLICLPGHLSKILQEL